MNTDLLLIKRNEFTKEEHQDLPVVSVDLELLGSVHPLQSAKALHTKIQCLSLESRRINDFLTLLLLL